MLDYRLLIDAVDVEPAKPVTESEHERQSGTRVTALIPRAASGEAPKREETH